MSNMSYCRFQNTLNDLRDCEENLFDDLEKGEDRETNREYNARKMLVELCHDIASQVPLDEIDDLPYEEF